MSERGPSRGGRPGGSARAAAETPGDTGRVILVASVAAIAGFLFGFDTAVINGAVAAVATNEPDGPALPGTWRR
jgi:hypothetical protein